MWWYGFRLPFCSCCFVSSDLEQTKWATRLPHAFASGSSALPWSECTTSPNGTLPCSKPSTPTTSTSSSRTTKWMVGSHSEALCLPLQVHLHFDHQLVTENLKPSQLVKQITLLTANNIIELNTPVLSPWKLIWVNALKFQIITVRMLNLDNYQTEFCCKGREEVLPSIEDIKQCLLILRLIQDYQVFCALPAWK